LCGYLIVLDGCWKYLDHQTTQPYGLIGLLNPRQETALRTTGQKNFPIKRSTTLSLRILANPSMGPVLRSCAASPACPWIDEFYRHVEVCRLHSFCISKCAV